jgi:catechol 2,3-dioxygenase-like lactoylglutathione lyase family enzyme
VKPIGFDSIVLKVADVKRSSDFYSHFFKTARATEKGQVAFAAADTRIVVRPVTAGESPGVERYAMRVAAFDRATVLKGLTALGASPEAKGPAGVVRFRDPNGLAVELKAV